MRKSVEMKKQLAAMKNVIDELQQKGEISEAYAKLKEFKELKESIEIQEALEADDDSNFIGKPINKIITPDTYMKNRIFNKMVLKKHLTDEETNFVTMAAGTPGQVGATDAKGGYLLPEEQMNRLAEFRRDLISLKPLCEIIPVSRRSGHYPTTIDDTGELTDFEELNEIVTGDVDFGNVAFTIHDRGMIIPVANQLLEDIDVDLIGLLGRKFARKAVRTENTKIINLMPSTGTAITTYKDIKHAFNVTLDPAIADGAALITNQDGFDYLDQLETTDNKPLLQPLLTDPTKMLFTGHNVIKVSNAQLPTASGAIPIYVGNMIDYMKFFDRKQVSLAVSTEAGFTKNSTMLRAIERFDVQVGDSAAMVKLTYTKA